MSSVRPEPWRIYRPWIYPPFLPFPYRILDAPKLVDDFYLNLIDWSSTNLIAVALGSMVFIWKGAYGDVTILVTCVSWIKSGTHLAVGTKKGWILLYDVRRGRLVQRIPAHWDRVTCLDWTGPVLSSGSKDCSISHRDVRIPSSPSSPRVGEANRLERAHSSEVCRIKWASNPAHFAPRRPVLPDAPNGLWASGGNDNIVRIWDNRMARTPLHNLSHHRGAIKALGWSPHERHVLASAGGAKDQKLCIWSTATARLLAETPTGSQVCDLVWSPFNNELCTAQGYRDSSLRVWRYDGHNLHNMACLETSAKRVIYLTLAPDGESVLSGSPDFMLRLWKAIDEAF
ncbi:WD40-repeat-containing domain protein [Piptocephalis cylindrospora]|uniref:WD40-repeat-containing domain protein n=1 Tax=Piptocephalis cylindrospora TaxID=1907219 RepID=A0A4P9Y6R3_9FUNG|nr:WD40-repeat-containing domain protein [Piptocephalis cylindrospora]|eukprot:RKP14788.1 WD40-repeat-containing domain protein [Piptocephalis cylindrospora]